VSATATNASSTSQGAAGVATSGTYRQLVEIYGTAAATTFTPPSGQTERADSATSGSGSVTLEAADKSLGAAGATGTSTSTSALTAVGAHVTIALRPLTTPFARTLLTLGALTFFFVTTLIAPQTFWPVLGTCILVYYVAVFVRYRRHRK
jgi:hypothetical protein